MERFRLRSEYVKLSLAVVLCIFGCLMLIFGFFAPPVGEIHNSVLVAFGEVSTFAGAILGLNYVYSTKMKQIEIDLKKQYNEKK